MFAVPMRDSTAWPAQLKSVVKLTPLSVPAETLSIICVVGSASGVYQQPAEIVCLQGSS
jgi:hypothetical protein